MSEEQLSWIHPRILMWISFEAVPMPVTMVTISRKHKVIAGAQVIGVFAVNDIPHNIYVTMVTYHAYNAYQMAVHLDSFFFIFTPNSRLSCKSNTHDHNLEF